MSEPTAASAGTADAAEAAADGDAADPDPDSDAAALRENPDFAVVCSFLSVFGDACALEPVAAPTLLRDLKDVQRVPPRLEESLRRLLRRAVRNFRPNAWEKSLVKFCHQLGHRQEAWEVERFGFKKANVGVKVKILKCLLEHQFVCNAKFKAAVNKMENRRLRLEPVGRDQRGRRYWLQRDRRSDLRLYREDQDEEIWELVAGDREGVVEAIASLKSGESPRNAGPESNEDSNDVGTDDASEKFPERAEAEAFAARPPADESELSNAETTPAPVPADSAGREDPRAEEGTDAVGEEIREEVMLVVGEGSGRECDTGNPAASRERNEGEPAERPEAERDTAEAGARPADPTREREPPEGEAAPSAPLPVAKRFLQSLPEPAEGSAPNGIGPRSADSTRAASPERILPPPAERFFFGRPGCLKLSPAPASVPRDRPEDAGPATNGAPAVREAPEAAEKSDEAERGADAGRPESRPGKHKPPAGDESVEVEEAHAKKPKLTEDDPPATRTERLPEDAPRAGLRDERSDDEREKIAKDDEPSATRAEDDSRAAKTEKSPDRDAVEIGKTEEAEEKSDAIEGDDKMDAVETAENSTEATPTAAETAKAPIAIETEEKPTVVETEAAPIAVETEEIPIAIENTETPTAVETKEKLETVTTEEKPDAVETDERTDAVKSEENPDTIETDEKMDTIESEEKLNTVKTKKVPVAAVTEENPDTLETKEKLDTVKIEQVPVAAVTEEKPDASEIKVKLDTVKIEETPVASATEENPGTLETEEKLDTAENKEKDTVKTEEVPVAVANKEEPPDAAETEAKLDTTETEEKPDAVKTKEKLDRVKTKEVPIAIVTKEKPDAVKSNEAQELTLEAKEKPDTIEVKEKSDTIETKEKLDTAKSKEKLDTVKTKEKPNTVKAKEAPVTLETKEKLDTVKTEEVSVTLDTKEKPDTVKTREAPDALDTKEKPDAAETKERPETVETEEKTDTVKTEEKLTTASSGSKASSKKSASRDEPADGVDSVDDDDDDDDDESKRESEERPQTRKRLRQNSGSSEETVKKNKRTKLRQKKTKFTHRKKTVRKKAASTDEESEKPPISDENKTKAAPVRKPKALPKATKKNIQEKKDPVEESPDAIVEQDPPIRQSRRIAQLKIKEEAQRRLLEEMALKELKAQHKKKNNNKAKVDQDWKKSSEEHSSDDATTKKIKGKVKKDKKWNQSSMKWNSSSGGNETDSDQAEPEDDFDEADMEEDILVMKSDHEFSPESDVEGDDVIPVRRARTLKKDDEDVDEVDGGCVYCGKADHPEWILLCDSCDAGWHASCLKPVLFLVPEGEWFCPPCNHKSLINALEEQLKEYDEHVKNLELEDLNRNAEVTEVDSKTKGSGSEFEESEAGDEEEKVKDSDESDSDDNSSSNSSDSSDDEKIYRLRERRQLPISYRFKEYDQLISSAIKEEYKEDENGGAGNQGRGKDISTIIEADKEEKKALLQGTGDEEKPEKPKVLSSRPRRKPRKLNSLDVVSDDPDDNSDEDFKETCTVSSSTSGSASSESEKSSSGSASSDSLPLLRRTSRQTTASSKSRRIVDSPELKKKKRRIFDSTSEESEEEEYGIKKKKYNTFRHSISRRISKKKSKKNRSRSRDGKERSRDKKKTRVKVKYGGLSDSSGESHDWSPAHRTRQKKYNYTEMPNTESEEEAHKPSGKHMDSSDEYKAESDSWSESDSSKERNKRKLKSGDEDDNESLASHQKQEDSQKVKSLCADLLKGSMVPVVKLSNISPVKSNSEKGSVIVQKDDEKTETAINNEAIEGEQEKSVIMTPLQLERERKRKEKEEKNLEKEKRKEERIKKKEERIMLKEQKAKEREEKKQARLASKEQNKFVNKKIRTDYSQSNLPLPIPIVNATTARNVAIPIQPSFVQMSPSPVRNITPLHAKLNQPDATSPISEESSTKTEHNDQILNYKSEVLNRSLHATHPPSGADETNKAFMDVAKNHSAFDERKMPVIAGPRPDLINQRILPPPMDPSRPPLPGYNSNIPPEHAFGRHIAGPIGDHVIPRNGIPITDMTVSSGLPRHISPNRSGIPEVLPENPLIRGATPKRRGRGPGKKTLARQAAAAAAAASTGIPSPSEGSSPRPLSSNSPASESGALTVAGAPQPFRPSVDTPSIITRMPHMMPPPYRGSSVFNSNTIYGPPRGPLPNHIPLSGPYRPHQPHPLDPSPSGGGPISMTSPGRSSPHGHQYPPYQSPSFYASSSTPPQLVSHPQLYSSIHGRFPSPHIATPPPVNSAPVNTPETTVDMDDKSKVFREKSEPNQFVCKSEIKQEPEAISVKQSTSPTEELDGASANEESGELATESTPLDATTTTPSRIHPQIKHTESKADRGRSRIAVTAAARYPQGPYAPQYGPYAPYPPPPTDLPYMHPPPIHVIHPNPTQPLSIHKTLHPAPQIPIPHRPPLIPMPPDHVRLQDSSEMRESPQNSSPNASSTSVQNEEETGEFGGLVSYFSSQQQDDIDT